MVDETKNTDDVTDETLEVDDVTEANDEVVEESHLEDGESEDTPETGVPDPESTEAESDDTDEVKTLKKQIVFWETETREARTEAKNLRIRLREAETKVMEPDESALQTQITSLENELRTERLTNHLTPKVQEAGAIDPEILVNLVHPDDVKWDGNTPTNLDGLVDGLKAKHPRQFRATNGSGNVASTNEAQGGYEGMTARELLMTEYSKN